MRELNTEHLLQCIRTLESSLTRLESSKPDSIDYEVFRNATIKGFELTLETSGKLLRKALKAYMGSPRLVDELNYKDLFRHAAKHGFLDTHTVQRWFTYRDNRNNAAHDYGIAFKENTFQLLSQFIKDAETLQHALENKLSKN